MTSSSHLASSALIYLVGCAVVETPPSIDGVVFTAIGSLLPDVDLPTSAIGRPVFPIASWINRKVGHRTLTHSLVGILLFGLLMLGIGWMAWGWLGSPAVWRCLTLGYAAHVLVDTLNKSGVDLFWPARVRAVFFGSDRYRIVSAGTGDYWFMTACLVTNVALYPLARDGFTFSLHQAFGDIYSVSTDFKEYGDRNRIHLELEAIDVLSNQKVKGRFEILAAIDAGAVLIERNGMKQIVSRSAPLHLFPQKAKIAIGDPCAISTFTTDMSGKTLGELPRYAGASRVLYYGYLAPAKMSPLRVHQDRYDPVAIKLDKIRLEHAEMKDIESQGIGHLVIRDGVVVARVSDLPQAVTPKEEATTGGETVRLVELRIRPDDEVLIHAGDWVTVGQVIVKHDVTNKLDRLQLELDSDIRQSDADFRETELQLARLEAELARAEAEAEGLEGQLASVSTEALLGDQAKRIRTTLEQQQEKMAELEAQELLFRSRRSEIETRKESRLRAAESQRDGLVSDSAVKAGFEGRVVRIARESAANEVIVRVVYQGP